MSKRKKSLENYFASAIDHSCEISKHCRLVQRKN